MQFKEAEAIVAKLTYKRGYRLALERSAPLPGAFYRDREEFAALLIRYVDEDVDGISVSNRASFLEYEGFQPIRIQRRQTEISNSQPIRIPLGNIPDSKYLLHEIFALVLEAEKHEVMEWLRYEGRPVKEPHPELHKDRAIL